MKSWRARKFKIVIGRLKLIISLRRFRTKPSNRSQTYRQFVIQLPITSIREVSFRVTIYKRRPGRAAGGERRRRLRQTFPYGIMTLGIFGSLFFGLQVTEARSITVPKAFSAPAAATQIKPTAPVIKPLAASLPTYITIPAVNIAAPVMSVGQAADGSIQLPPVLEWTTGWYKYSPTPGQIGPSVIVGHVDNYKNISVFWRLRYALPGDDIYINRADGSTVHFKVTGLQQVNQANFPTASVYGNISYPGLRLITCGGTFSTTTDSYNQNTVVFASMVQ